MQTSPLSLLHPGTTAAPATGTAQKRSSARQPAGEPERAADGTALPCLLGGDTRFFLVRACSARDIPSGNGVQVLSGEQRLVLPPSPELRWETAPWSRTGPVAVELVGAGVLVERLAAATAPGARR
ncbi:hypothetical protein [Streptomyces clavuligerus]|uniref:hypothetical protein n=1 Tax=Streptomyces clavuligerus TaxID=1901 RepID=UPI00020D9336|nr:hypothetical protein [Streptomyces clavuligerus]WDN55975.1 hypothetical protein LL058_29235 [Streptomyces clavuligerus]